MGESRWDHELFQFLDVRQQSNEPAQLTLVRRDVYKSDKQPLASHMDRLHKQHLQDFQQQRPAIRVTMSTLKEEFKQMCREVEGLRLPEREAAASMDLSSLLTSQREAIYAYTLPAPKYYKILNDQLHEARNAVAEPKLNLWQEYLYQFDTGLARLRDSQRKRGHVAKKLYRLAFLPEVIAAEHFSPDSDHDDVVFKAFSSSTTSELVARTFFEEQKLDPENRGKVPVVFELDEVASSEAVDIRWLSKIRGEQEWVIPAYFRAKVVACEDATDFGPGVRRVHLRGLRRLPQLSSVVDWQEGVSVSQLLGLAVLLCSQQLVPGYESLGLAGDLSNAGLSLAMSLVRLEDLMHGATKPEDPEWFTPLVAAGLVGGGVGVAVEVAVVGLAAVSGVGFLLAGLFALTATVAYLSSGEKRQEDQSRSRLHAAAASWCEQLKSVGGEVRGDLEQEGPAGLLAQFFRGFFEGEMLHKATSVLQPGELGRLLHVADPVWSQEIANQTLFSHIEDYREKLYAGHLKVSGQGLPSISDLLDSDLDPEALRGRLVLACGQVEEAIVQRLAETLAPHLVQPLMAPGGGFQSLGSPCLTRLVKHALIARSRALATGEASLDSIYSRCTQQLAADFDLKRRKPPELLVVHEIARLAVLRSQARAHAAAQPPEQQSSQERVWMKSFAKMLVETNLIEKLVEVVPAFKADSFTCDSWCWAPAPQRLCQYAPSAHQGPILHPVLAAIAVGNRVLESATSHANAVPDVPISSLKTLASLDLLRLRLSRTRVVLPLGEPDAGKTTIVKHSFNLDLTAGYNEDQRTSFLSFHRCPDISLDSSELLFGDSPGFGEEGAELQSRNDAVWAASRFALNEKLRDMMLVLVVLRSGRDVKVGVNELVAELVATGTSVLIVFTFADESFKKRNSTPPKGTKRSDPVWLQECARRVQEEDQERVDRLLGGPQHGLRQPSVLYTCFFGPFSEVEQDDDDDAQEVVSEWLVQAFRAHFPLVSPLQLREEVLRHFGALGAADTA